MVLLNLYYNNTQYWVLLQYILNNFNGLKEKFRGALLGHSEKNNGNSVQ